MFAEILVLLNVLSWQFFFNLIDFLFFGADGVHIVFHFFVRIEVAKQFSQITSMLKIMQPSEVLSR